MLLNKYEQSGVLFNTNFKSVTSKDNVVAYRGELVLIEGGVGDDKGHAKPPVAVMRHTILLAEGDKLVFVAGAIDKLELLTNFINKFKTDFAPGMKAHIFVVNIKQAMQVEAAGINFVLVPLKEGVAWNELIDELALEKSDFKGQSAADKVVALLDYYKDYQPKYKTCDFEAAMSMTADIKREGYGAV
jgi:hypothetical protein